MSEVQGVSVVGGGGIGIIQVGLTKLLVQNASQNVSWAIPTYENVIRPTHYVISVVSALIGGAGAAGVGPLKNHPNFAGGLVGYGLGLAYATLCCGEV